MAATWPVRSTSENVVEISSPDAVYTLDAKPAMMRIEVLRDNSIIESATFTRTSPHDFILEGTEGQESKLRLVIRVHEGNVVTEASLGQEILRVESPIIGHGFLLARNLKDKAYPRTPFIRQLVDELRDNPELRNEVRRRTGYSAVLGEEAFPNGPVAACVAVCLMCAAEITLACIMCVACLEYPPEELGAGGGTVTWRRP
jgi:hypothetical protein